MSTILALAGGHPTELSGMKEAVSDPGGAPAELASEGCTLAASGRARLARAPDGPGVALAADAALGAREALVTALSLAGAERRELADADLILRAYMRWGERCGEHLVGTWAFVLWDPRRELLVCGRDHIGSRPLHWWSDGTCCAVASDPEVLLAHPRAERRVDLEAYIASVVPGTRVELGRSVWQGVRKVPRGAVVALSPGGACRSRHEHWSPGTRPQLRLARPTDYAEALRDAIATATDDAVRAPAKIAAHLSGGLDSSAVAVLGQRALARRGRALERVFSWAPSPEDVSPVEDDERPRVRAVADRLGVPATFVGGDPEATEEHEARQRARRPANTSLFETSVVRRAERDGIAVVLTGWGGDELPSFNGRGVVARLARRGRLVRVAREVVALARHGEAEGPLPLLALKELHGRVVVPLAPERVLRRLGLGGLGEEIRIPDLLGTDAEVRAQAEELVHDARARMRHALAAGGRATQLELLHGGHITARLEAWALLGDEHGVEHRHPLLDRRVMDLCLSFPEELWLRDGWRRLVFRLAVDPLLPPGMAWSNAKHEPAFQAAPRSSPGLIRSLS